MSTTPYSPMVVTEQARPVHYRTGSVGPVIGVLAVIVVLGLVSVMIGRLCSGRKIMGHGHFDFERWVEMKCGSCIDGHVSVHHPVPEPPSPPPPDNGGGGGGGGEEAAEGKEEMTGQEHHETRGGDH